MKAKKSIPNLPSLEKMIELTKTKIKRPLNGKIVLFNVVAPIVSPEGVIMSKEAQQESQTQINKYGSTVVLLPTLREGEHLDVEVGERVGAAKDSPEPSSMIINTTEIIDTLKPELKKQFEEKTGRFETLNDKQISSYYKRYVLLITHPMFIDIVLPD